MMNFLKKINIGNIRITLQEVSVRFPLAMVLMLVVTGLFTYLNARDRLLDPHMTTILLKIIVTSIVSFFLSVSVSLLAESEKIRSIRALIIQIGVILFGAFFYYTLDGYVFESLESVVLIFLTLAGFLSLLFVAPFMRRIITRKYDQDAYYSYFYRTSLVFLISSIVGAAMMLLGFIAIGSVFALFDLPMLDQGKIFAYWSIFALSFFSPIFGLAHIPEKSTFEQKEGIENKFFTFLTKYIGVPFIYVYFLILYAYSIKVLLNFSDWPKGQITWMVIAFSIFGYMVYIFTHLLREENTLIKMFRKYFPALVIPQLLMLFYAIYLRIHQYDITMNRYFVVVFGVWLLGISLYYTLSKQKYLGFIPFSIGIIILIISVGPWSVYSLPAARQYDRLISNLEKAHILTNGDIVPLAKFSDVDSSLSGDIYDGINYMCDFSECKKIKTLFAKELIEKEKTSRADFEKNGGILPMGLGSNYGKRDSVYRGLTKWEVVQTVTNTIKVRNARFMDSVAQKYLSFHTNYDDDFFPLRLEGYEYIANIYGNAGASKLTHEKEELWISLDSDSGNLTIHKKDIIVETLSLTQILSDIGAKANGTNDINLAKESLIFEMKGTKCDVKLFIKNISILNPNYIKQSNDTNMYSYSSGYALVKEK